MRGNNVYWNIAIIFLYILYIKIHQFLTHPINEETLFNYLDDQNVNIYKEFIIKIVHTFARNEGIQIPMRKIQENVEKMISFEISLRNQISGIAKQMFFLNKVHRMTIAELQQYYNSGEIQGSPAEINWLDTIQSVFNNVNVSIDASEPVLVSEHHSLQQLASLLRDTPQRVIVNYMQWNIVSHLMRLLNKQIRNIALEYYYTNLNVTKRDPRWLVCIENLAMKDIMSYFFTKTYTSVKKNAVLRMVNEIKTEIKERIFHSWMTNNTKINIINKIDNLLVLIGYPKKYNNETIFIERYKDLNIGKNYFDNWLRIKKHDIKRMQINFRKKVLVRKNRDELAFDPMFPYAYYTSENVIVIPAALIKDLYFMSMTPIAINYGAIGSIIGHEISHSFGPDKFTTILDVDDSNMIQVDIEDIFAYSERSKCFIQQYNNFILNMTDQDTKSFQIGYTVFTENIADFIGIQAAFTVFQKRKAKKEPQMKFESITDEKLFFLSFVNQFCESSEGLYGTDVSSTEEHGYANYRVISSLANMASFSEAFNCPVGSTMNPRSKCKIWY